MDTTAIALGAGALIITNILSVFLTIAQAKSRVVLSGILAGVRWPLNLYTLGIGLESRGDASPMQHYGTLGILITSVVVAEMLGTWLGTKYIKRLRAQHHRAPRLHRHVAEPTLPIWMPTRPAEPSVRP